MSPFLLALVGTALVALGGREAVRVAQLAVALGPSKALLVAGWLACSIGCLVAARLGEAIAALMAPRPTALLAAVALLAAAVELLVRRARPAPAEPTRSFGAVVLVLATGQLTGAAALLVFAVAGASGVAWLAAAGGTLGSGAVVTAAWSSGPEWERRVPRRLLRIGVAGLLLAVALVAGFSAGSLR